ncbi:MAG TPA: Fe-S cluster assembly protein HesB [Stellaceae bacterium]|jgi:endonuclease-3
MRQSSFDFGEGSILSELRDRLLAVFGPQRDAQRFDPLSQLVYGILASKTKDAVSMAAFEHLRRRCHSWEALLHAAPRAIERVIATVNHADRKAEDLPRALRMIRARTGALDLDFLADWDVEAVLQWLDGLPGVGPKIAATVLNFSSLRMRVLAVDTHLLRVGERLGILRAGADYQQAYDGYARLLPEDWDADALYELHWLIKRLGQRYCRPTLPACGVCPLREACPSRGLSPAAA